jgi:hypothetical protein
MTTMVWFGMVYIWWNGMECHPTTLGTMVRAGAPHLISVCLVLCFALAWGGSSGRVGWMESVSVRAKARPQKGI